MPEDLSITDWLLVWLGASGILFLLTLMLGLVILGRVKPVKLREGIGFFEALRETPFLVAVFLDVLDLCFDLLGAPVAWYVLGKLGLGKLRGVAVVEALIPFTQVIPTMTVCWVLARLRKAPTAPTS